MNQLDKLKEEFDNNFIAKQRGVKGNYLIHHDAEEIWSWIIQNFTPKEEMRKMLERVEKEVIGKDEHCGVCNDIGMVYVGDKTISGSQACPKCDAKSEKYLVKNELKENQRQSLNKLKKENYENKTK